MTSIFHKIDASFRASLKGEETTHNLIWWWGAIAYFVAYFIIDKFIKINNFQTLDIIISLVTTTYFAWHIYALKKCSPKKPKLTKEEKRKIRAEARRNFAKSFMRKLFLQEPISDNWDPVFITIVIDFFCIANFLGYLTK